MKWTWVSAGGGRGGWGGKFEGPARRARGGGAAGGGAGRGRGGRAGGGGGGPARRAGAHPGNRAYDWRRGNQQTDPRPRQGHALPCLSLTRPAPMPTPPPAR